MLTRTNRTLGIAVVCAALLLTSACRPQVEAATLGQPGPAPREFRGVWIATVDNIDWPSRKGLPVAKQRRELEYLFDVAGDLKLNAVILQVRPACDALYPSELEPWSEWLSGREGEAPDPEWDPLKFAIDAAHARGLELHAWFNPFRARHNQARSPAAEDHVARDRRGLVVRYGSQLWLDPGLPEARAHSLAVIRDVVRRYDVDGVHIDDYFYPYPEGRTPFPDAQSYRRYRDSGGKLGLLPWRRANVDRFVEELYRAIKAEKSWVRFGISPFGIARPGLPKTIKAGIDQYDDLAADVVRWLDEGWCDYLVPQLYWPIADRPHSYSVLLAWWVRQNPRGRHLWIGNIPSRIADPKHRWPASEILRQLRMTRAEAGATGNVYFSMRALRDDAGGLATALRRGPYKLPALVPASTWLDSDPPAAPELRVEAGDAGSVEVLWSSDPEALWRAVYLRRGGEWVLVDVLDSRKPGFEITARQLRELDVSAVAVSSVDRCGNEGKRTVRAIRGD